MDLCALENLVDLVDEPAWKEFSLKSDTDEDWSVSESSSESGIFIECLDEVVNRLPQGALCHLDLLASNTESAQSLLPFEVKGGVGGSGEQLFTGIKEEMKADSEVPAYQKRRPGHVLTAFASAGGQAGAGAGQAVEIAIKHEFPFFDPEDDEQPAPVVLATPSNRSTPLNRSPSAPDANRKRKFKTGEANPAAGSPSKRLSISSDSSKSSGGRGSRSSSTSSSSNVSTVRKGSVDSSGAKAAISGAKRNKSGKRCEFCLEVFETTEKLQAHRNEHIVEPSHFKCTFEGCNKLYATGEGLRLHVRNVHLLAKNWKCLSEGCSRSFVRQSDLRMHIIRMHSDIRPFPCPVNSCNKSFACHSELRRHVLSCHKLPCPKPEKVVSKTNCVDKAYIEALMMKAE